MASVPRRNIQIRFPCSLKAAAKKRHPCWQRVRATCSACEAAPVSTGSQSVSPPVGKWPCEGDRLQCPGASMSHRLHVHVLSINTRVLPEPQRLAPPTPRARWLSSLLSAPESFSQLASRRPDRSLGSGGRIARLGDPDPVLTRGISHALSANIRGLLSIVIYKVEIIQTQSEFACRARVKIISCKRTLKMKHFSTLILICLLLNKLGICHESSTEKQVTRPTYVHPRCLRCVFGGSDCTVSA